MNIPFICLIVAAVLALSVIFGSVGFPVFAEASKDTVSSAAFAGQTKSNYELCSGNNEATLGIRELSASGDEKENFSSEDGMTFSTEPVYKSTKTLSKTPNTFEATLLLPENLGNTRGGVIFGNYGSTTPNINFEVAANGAPRLYWVNAKGKVIDIVFTNTNVFTGEWVHLAIVRDSKNNKFLCYVDGVLCDSKEVLDSEDLIISTSYVLGGDLRGGNAQAFRGKLKNVAVYSDARTADEIKSDMNEPGNDKSDLLFFYDLVNVDKSADIIKDGGDCGYDLKSSYIWFDKEIVNDEDYDYSFAIVGDTQVINYRYPEAYFGIYDWILDNVKKKKIKCVIGTGDITDRNSEEEWLRAQTIMKRMNGVVPFTMVRGNHDSVMSYNKYMNTKANLAQIEGSYDTGIENTWRTLKVGDIDYLIIGLDYGARDPILEWAGKIIEEHPNHKVIITTHCYMFRDGTTLDDGDVVPPSKGGDGLNDGDDMWEKFVSKYENIIMVISGHDPCEKVVMTPDVGVHGNTVCQFLIDPQGIDAGTQNGAGLVALFCFSKDGSRCRVEYYSTIKKKFYLSENQFIFDLKTGERVDKLNVEQTDTESDKDLPVNENTDKDEEEKTVKMKKISLPIVILIASAVIVLAAIAVAIIHFKIKK